MSASETRIHKNDRAGTTTNPGRQARPDVTVRFPVGLEVGYDRFFGGAYLREADFKVDTADFFYLQAMVGF